MRCFDISYLYILLKMISLLAKYLYRQLIAKWDKRKALFVLAQKSYYTIDNSTLNVDPLPAPSDSAQILPPWASINPFAMVSPMPSPP